VCGIAGVANSRADALVDTAQVRRMCDAIRHRGPDDEGFYVRGGVGLGMRRLSIIDLVSGQQPIHNEDKSIWLVFNGEIYNFPQLRRELEGAGHHFYTQSDTEVIVHLYEDLGSDCVKKLRGMFGFALYDERRQRLLLARDRLGKKPLHYALVDGQLLFGSEIKALLAVAPQLKDISREALLQYFHFGYIPDPDTAFTSIKKLPPGHLLEFANGQVQIRPYWDLPAYADVDPQSEEECVEQLEHVLAEAVRIRLISDVPLGALLSGGVDSSTVVALMARASSRPVRTFSIGFPEQDFDEAGYARKVARQFGTEHEDLVVDFRFGETLEKLSASMEEPFADASLVPTYYICRLARQSVTVALSGDGGDELFAGYGRYAIHEGRRGFEFLPQDLGRWYRRRIHNWLPSSTPGRHFLFNVLLPEGDRYLDSIAKLPPTRDRSVFTPDFLAWADRQPSPFEAFRRFLEDGPAHDPLSRIQYLDTKTYLPGDILTKVDRMSMAVSLEVRVPLLDQEVVEWATRLAPRWKLRGKQGKYILRKLAERLGVPRDVLDRPKRGFSMPLVNWFRKELKEDLARLLLEPRTLQRGYLDGRVVRQMLDEHFRGRRVRTGQIWLLLMLELWHRNFIEGQNDLRAGFGAPLSVSGVPAVGGRPVAANLGSSARGE
jgi:asparagine synthase (glutamine-hydrolysing)